jgi:hypoxanthine phosphoribosyltransferase
MQILLPADRLQVRIAEMAKEIARDYEGRPVTIVGVLTGCLMFLADLVRHLDLRLRIDFVQASSYRGATTTAGELAIDPATVPDIRGRDVLLLDDILDTGHTLHHLVDLLRKSGAQSIRVGVLLRKIGRQTVPFEPNYCGFEIPDVFVVGYGLDYNDEYRHLPYVGVFDESK